MTATPAEELFGRDEVLRRLVAALDGLADGGRAIGLVGDPGVGKTAVQTRVVDHARSTGATVLSARGSQAETHLPYAALYQLLRPVLTYVDRLPARQAQSLLACFGMVDSAAVNPFFTALAVLEVVAEAASEAPVLVALDDVHWMDRPTVDALAFVVRRIGTEPVLVLATSRPEPQLFGAAGVVEWVRLEGLPDDAADALLQSRTPGLAAGSRGRVRASAGGNPLALVEFAQALTSGTATWTEPDGRLPLSARLEHAFAARADELTEAARAVVDVAVVDDGDDLDEVLAAAAVLAGGPVGRRDAWPAVELGFLTVLGPTYAVRHPLVRSALGQAMSRERREQGHAALARVLSDQPERAVWHRASAVSGRDEPIAAELERTAADDRRRGAFATALVRFERAAALSPDPGDQAARLLSAAEVGYELGRFGQVEEISTQVARLTIRPRDQSRLRWLTGAFHDGAASEPAEVRHLVELARAAARDDDPDLAMQLLFGAARRVWWRDPGEAVRREIIGAAREVALPADDARVLAVFGLAESLELGASVIAQLDRLGAGGPAAPPVLLGIAAFCTGDFARADLHLSAAIRQLRADGRLSLLAEALAIRAWAEINLGIFDAARSADEGMRLADETGQRVWAATARIAVALTEAVGGRLGSRDALVTAAEQTALQLPNASSSLLAGVQLVRGVGELGRDRFEQAYGELARVFVPTDAAYQRVQQVWTLGYLAEAAVRTGRRAEAVAVAASVEAQASGTSAQGTLIALEYAHAVLADDESAEALFRTARSGAGRRYPWHRARLDLAYGAWLRRQRRLADSRDPLRAARAAFDALGAEPWARRADQELRATGERGWQPTTNAGEQLTAQEMQIAELAARGLSNREIGQRLFLSHRTVGSHLYRIFPKLGVTSRQQLTSVLPGRLETVES